ncbi:hypothetical protein AMAG_18534 [Allomyces macrogynus ATCC 38327]|uniref:Uncharacterized protein n=1 Tax=Allomyces macrogynus (strain ATCC 38327) TaxID=578462 RepID=A0A0L0SDC5_ALLM3|nr:hypothetical protein AMAG_18534 [Allomyces macrogynus ATCC 38327]|eukprot:KNE60434.1 hypothetical protein AMAG_18534 [Allomyces macrogynus ATCC 38327]
MDIDSASERGTTHSAPTSRRASITDASGPSAEPRPTTRASASGTRSKRGTKSGSSSTEAIAVPLTPHEAEVESELAAGAQEGMNPKDMYHDLQQRFARLRKQRVRMEDTLNRAEAEISSISIELQAVLDLALETRPDLALEFMVPEGDMVPATCPTDTIMAWEPDQFTQSPGASRSSATESRSPRQTKPKSKPKTSPKAPQSMKEMLASRTAAPGKLRASAPAPPVPEPKRAARPTLESLQAAAKAIEGKDAEHFKAAVMDIDWSTIRVFADLDCHGRGSGAQSSQDVVKALHELAFALRKVPRRSSGKIDRDDWTAGVVEVVHGFTQVDGMKMLLQNRSDLFCSNVIRAVALRRAKAAVESLETLITMAGGWSALNQDAVTNLIDFFMRTLDDRADRVSHVENLFELMVARREISNAAVGMIAMMHARIAEDQASGKVEDFPVSETGIARINRLVQQALDAKVMEHQWDNAQLNAAIVRARVAVHGPRDAVQLARDMLDDNKDALVPEQIKFVMDRLKRDGLATDASEFADFLLTKGLNPGVTGYRAVMEQYLDRADYSGLLARFGSKLDKIPAAARRVDLYEPLIQAMSALGMHDKVKSLHETLLQTPDFALSLPYFETVMRAASDVAGFGPAINRFRDMTYQAKLEPNAAILGLLLSLAHVSGNTDDLAKMNKIITFQVRNNPTVTSDAPELEFARTVVPLLIKCRNAPILQGQEAFLEARQHIDALLAKHGTTVLGVREWAAFLDAAAHAIPQDPRRLNQEARRVHALVIEQLHCSNAAMTDRKYLGALMLALARANAPHVVFALWDKYVAAPLDPAALWLGARYTIPPPVGIVDPLWITADPVDRVPPMPETAAAMAEAVGRARDVFRLRALSNMAWATPAVASEKGMTRLPLNSSVVTALVEAFVLCGDTGARNLMVDLARFRKISLKGERIEQMLVRLAQEQFPTALHLLNDPDVVTALGVAKGL